MAKVAFFHNALGKTDGVSLEVDKWRAVLEIMGHTVFYCAGNDDAKNVYCIPELSFMHPVSNKILRNATVKLVDYKTEQDLEKDIYEEAAIIKEKLLEFIKKNEIDILIPNNLLSVGYHLPALIALSEVIKETGLPTIAHNHDFYFEDSGEVHPTCDVAQNILDTYSPPAYPNVQNLVINKLAQKALLEKKGIHSTVVPNVFDFNQPQWQEDDYNSDFRQEMQIGENDLVFLQATRVMDRKGIELAIDVIAELNKPENKKLLAEKTLYNGKKFSENDKIVLLCSGHIESFGATDSYHENLLKRAEKEGVDIRFVGERVKHSRGELQGKKVYSLWDSYVHSDFVTYPSLWEGWGNQFIEAIFAKLPVVLFEYPVFVSDLKEDDFSVVSLGDKISGTDEMGLAVVDERIISQAAQEIVAILTDKEKYTQIVEKNFRIAKEKYSFETLRTIIEKLLAHIA